MSADAMQFAGLKNRSLRAPHRNKATYNPENAIKVIPHSPILRVKKEMVCRFKSYVAKYIYIAIDSLLHFLNARFLRVRI